MKPLSLLFVALAPLLSMVDAVDGAPASGMHRRAVGNVAHAPWHKRQGDNASGPPSIIVVGGDPTPTPSGSTTTTTSTSTSTSTSATDSGASSGASTDPNATTGTDASTTPTSSDGGNFLSSLLSGLLPTNPTTGPVTTGSPTTDPVTTPTTDPVITPTSTDTGGILDPVTSLVGGITSDVGGIVSSVTSGVGGIVTSATSDIGGVTSDLPPTTTDNPNTDPPPTTTDVPPTTTISTTDPGNGGGVVTTTTTSISTSSNPPLDVTDVFPGGSGNQSITTTVTESVKPTTISIDSDFQFITASTFVIAPSSTTTLDVTNTDPDAVQTSAVVGGSGTTLTAASIPTSIPMFITPPASSDPTPPGTIISGYTEISILFKSTANWLWVLGSSETAAQILAYLGPMIASSLEISTDDVKTVGLKAFVPNDYAQESDLQTIWLGQIPSDQVSTLAALIKAPNSKFYHSGDGIADSIAANVVMSFNIATVSGVDNSNGAGTQSSSGSSSTNHSQRNAIIGVSVAFGVVVLVVTAYWLTKMYKGRQEGSHKRLSYRGNANYGSTAAGGNTAAFAAGAGGVTYGAYDRDSRGDPGLRADSPPALHNPFLTDQEREEQARGIRRNSFYAIGPDDESIEEETFDYLSQRTSTISGGLHGYGGPASLGAGGSALNRAGSGGSGGRGGNAWGTGARGGQGAAVRRPVIGQPISQPILRESSMGNW